MKLLTHRPSVSGGCRLFYFSLKLSTDDRGRKKSERRDLQRSYSQNVTKRKGESEKKKNFHCREHLFAKINVHKVSMQKRLNQEKSCFCIPCTTWRNSSPQNLPPCCRCQHQRWRREGHCGCTEHRRRCRRTDSENDNSLTYFCRQIFGNSMFRVPALCSKSFRCGVT